MSKWAIGIDLGGTKIKLARVSNHGDLLEEKHFPTEASRGPQAIISDILHAVRTFQPKASVPIGIGIAGQVEPNTGAVRFAPNLKWRNVPLQEILHKNLNAPVVVVNDVRAATWAEWQHGAGVGCTDLVCLFVGTGIGGGIVSASRLITGYTNCAGEFGHMIINPNGPLCGCGNHGCLEAWAGGAGLARQARELLKETPSTRTAILRLAEGLHENITTKIIAQAYLEGDAIAEKLYNSAAQALVWGCTGIVHALNPNRLVLGGGVIEGFPQLVAHIRQGLQKTCLPAASESLDVLNAKLKANAGVIGAASLALSHMKGHTHDKP